MLSVTIQRKIFITIAWCLTALLLGGSLLNALPTLKDTEVSAEERVLESDDDRSHALQFDLTLPNQVDEHPTSQTWQEVQVFYFVHSNEAVPSANLQRGPPLLVC